MSDFHTNSFHVSSHQNIEARYFLLLRNQEKYHFEAFNQMHLSRNKDSSFYIYKDNITKITDLLVDQNTNLEQDNTHPSSRSQQ